MIDTRTITSRDSRQYKKGINLSSLTDYKIDTVTIRAVGLDNMQQSFNVISAEMQEFESAAIYDFLRFEETN